MEVTPKTWLISDTHFGHKNIIKYCNRPMEHNYLMLKGWTSMIRPEETVLHLGDLMVWYGKELDYWKATLESLPGKKFFLRGNHDKFKTKEYKALNWTEIPEFIQEIKGQRVLFSHYPDTTRISEWDINIHGHIHNNELDPWLKKSGRRYTNISVELTNYAPIRAEDVLVF